MALLGSIIARSLNLRKALAKQRSKPSVYQERTLKKLLETAQYTQLGKHYAFDNILANYQSIKETYRNTVPLSDYNIMFKEWWHKLLEGEENVSWPGKVKYFALSSGTSESASKHIPVTNDMLKSIKKVAMKQFYSISNYPVNPAVYTKGVLMLGGSTSLQATNDYFEGDMSGISAKNIPRILSNIYYKPGQKISKAPTWEERIELIVKNAPKWDVGTLCGVPSWVQIVLERIINTYNLQSIHDIWPNLGVYIHGGVAFEPYKDYLAKMMSKPMTYIETYMASEGSFGFRATPESKGIKLMLNTGIFFEFLPFNEENFDEDGNLINRNAATKFIEEVDTDTPYAVVLSTCSGTWRYLIGDVVQFTDVAQAELILVGRTKQFLSICGEHTSIDNLNTAIKSVIKKYDLKITDFSVAGYREKESFTHHWYIGTENTSINKDELIKDIDDTLCKINDDYAVERTSALKNIELTILPGNVFLDFLKSQGKYGAMNKFPKVLKGKQLQVWQDYINNI